MRPYGRSAARLMLLVLTISVAGWQASAQTTSTLYTYSTIDALLAGTYDGDLTIRELSAKGDFGIGTYNRLDGEMLAIDGVFYHAKADGSVVIAGPLEKTPLAYVTHFHPTQTIKSDGCSPSTGTGEVAGRAHAKPQLVLCHSDRRRISRRVGARGRPSGQALQTAG